MAGVCCAQPYWDLNTIYLLSNESGQEDALDLLERLDAKAGNVHVGVSGWQNYDVIVARNSDAAVIVDINQATCELHRLTARAIQTADHVDDFVRRFFELLKKEQFPEFSKKDEIFQKRVYWLRHPGGYAKIRQMYLDHKIHILPSNIATSECFFNFRRIVDLSQIETLYISNVAEWLTKGAHDNELTGFVYYLRLLLAANPDLIVLYSDHEAASKCDQLKLKISRGFLNPFDGDRFNFDRFRQDLAKNADYVMRVRQILECRSLSAEYRAQLLMKASELPDDQAASYAEVLLSSGEVGSKALGLSLRRAIDLRKTMLCNVLKDRPTEKIMTTDHVRETLEKSSF
jgi:hypothetical protein